MLTFPFTIFKKIASAGFLLVLVWSLFTANAEEAGRLGRVTVESLYFRAEPSISANPLIKLKKGEEALILEEKSGWIKAVHMGKIGYIKGGKGYLKEVGSKKDKALGGLLETSQELDLRLQKSHEAITDISKDERETVQELQKIDSTLDQVKGKIRRTNKKIEGLNKKIQDTETRIAEADKNINIQKDSADKRIVALYKMHRLGAISLFASAENVFDLAKHKNSFERILEKDSKQLSDYANIRQRHAVLLEVQKEQQKEQAQNQKELKEQEESVASEKQKRDKLLTEVRKQKRLELAAQEMLKEAARKLDDKLISYAKSVSAEMEPSPPDSEPKLLKKKGSEKPEFEASESPVPVSNDSARKDTASEKSGPETTRAEPFERLKGLLKMPVKGKVITRFGSFHNPEYNITNFRSGIDIKAQQGDPIMAVHSGKVLYAAWFKGYGNMIILDHGGHFYTVYANIEELIKKTGDRVKNNEVIATVGDSGSIIGPKLYFEIRHFGKPLNPMKWIKTG
ncbi:MAG: peptidoglycan DD-metalloendopeptidase family protein [Proteobacteria bacterium]|nr:peptidoglycan DD-metalloendopeptidase family protein [Pseudomonadota bacterium]